MSFWDGFFKRASMTAAPEVLGKVTPGDMRGVTAKRVQPFSRSVNPIKRLAGLSSGQKRVLGAAGVIGSVGLGSMIHSHIKSKERE